MAHEGRLIPLALALLGVVSPDPAFLRAESAFMRHDLVAAEPAYREVLATDTVTQHRVTAAVTLASLAWRVRGDTVAANRWLRQAPGGRGRFAAARERARMRLAFGDVTGARAAAHRAAQAATTAAERLDAEVLLGRVVIEPALAARLGTGSAAVGSGVLTATVARLLAAVERSPGALEPARLLVAGAILAENGPAALTGWRSYYPIDTGDTVTGVLAEPRRALDSLLPRLRPERAAPDERLIIAHALAASRLFAAAAALTLGDQRARDVVTYARFLHDIERLTNEFYRETLLGRPQAAEWRSALVHRGARLWPRLSWDGPPPAFTPAALVTELDRRFGATITLGETAGFADMHYGHRVVDERRAVRQYGREAAVRFVALDALVSNGFQSWAWNGRAAHGGWATGDVIVQVRSGYAEEPLQVWQEMHDAVAQREADARIAADSIADAARARTAALAYFPGVAGRLERDGRRRLLDSLAATGLQGAELEAAVTRELGRAMMESSIFAHEGRHAIDTAWPELSTADREFRAKLSQVAFAPYPRLTLGSILDANLGDRTPHGQANRRAMEGVLRWMEVHAAEIAGLDRSAPLLPQLPLLTDPQLRAAFRSMDPLASPAGAGASGRAASDLVESGWPEYSLTIRLEPKEHRIAVDGTMRLPATATARDVLELSLSERMRDVRFHVVQPAVSAGPPTLDGTTRPYSRPGWGTTTWSVRPSRPIPSGEPVLLRFSYRGDGDTTGFIYYVGAPVSFGAGVATAWYPELESEPLRPDGRLRGRRGTGSLTFSVPSGFRVYAEGQGLSPAAEEARGTFRFRNDAPVFFSFAAGPYVVRQSESGRPARIYFLRARPAMDDYLTGALRIVDALSREFGPYPFARFAIVEIPPDPAERAGFAGASVDGFLMATTDFLDQPFNTAYYGHEIGHQWWGGRVRAAEPRGNWMLTEGMAQYGSLRAVETIEGASAAEQYRRTGYPGFFDHAGLTYLMLNAAGADAPLADLPSEGALSRMLANSKGFLVWDMLARFVGRERFRSTLNEVVRRHANQRVPWDTLLAAISAGAGRDLSWFYEQWFQQTGALDWSVKWEQQRDSVAGTVRLERPPLHPTIDVEVRVAGEECPATRRQLTLSGPVTRFAWRVACHVDSIVLDPAFHLLHWTPEYRATANALVPYTRANLLFANGAEAEAEAAFRAALAEAPAGDRHELRFMLEYGLAQVLNAANKFAEAREHLEAALATPTQRPSVLPWVYLELARVARQLGDEALLRQAVRGAEVADVAAFGRPVASAQARALLR